MAFFFFFNFKRQRFGRIQNIYFQNLNFNFAGRQFRINHIGRTRGDFVNVETGLNAGDRVVSAGVSKLRSGASVQEN